MKAKDKYNFFYLPQRSCGKVMFLQASVILFRGGVHGGGHTLWGGGAAWAVHILLECILVINKLKIVHAIE